MENGDSNRKSQLSKRTSSSGKSERVDRSDREDKRAKDRARSRSNDRSGIISTDTADTEKRERRDKKAKDRARSRSGDRSGIASTDTADAEKRERRERREREDREAKERARSSRRSESGGDADAVKRDRRERREREDKEAKERARGSRASTSMSKSERHEREDREAKDRARGSRRSSSGTSATARVGAYSETDGSQVPSKSSRSRDSDRQDRDAKAKARASSSRASRPGVESVASSSNPGNSKSSRDISSRREKERAKMSEIIPDAPNVGADIVKEQPKEDEFAVEASLIDEEVEAVSAARKQEEENRILRQQMQEMEDRRRQEEEERVLREKEVAEKRKKKIVCAAVIFLLVVGGGVAGYFLSRPSEARPTSTGTAPGPTSPTDADTAAPVVSATTTPTSAVSTSPTSSPTVLSLFDPPSEEDCAAMKNGEDVPNQDGMKEQTFAVGMDVSFSLDVDFENLYVPELEKALQEYLPQTLAQCPDVNIGRRLRSNDPNRWVVGNARVSAEHKKDETCLENTVGLVCYRLSFTLQVWLKGEIDKAALTITTYVAEAFNKAPIIQLLKLTAPYLEIGLVSASGLDPTNAPTPSPSSTPTATMLPSQSPTSRPSAAPVDGPTTKRPTNTPSATPRTPQPSSSPTFTTTAATLSPTEGPTKFPTFKPTKRPTVLPATGVPTELASNSPTKEPTPRPTKAPSKSPTDTPSIQPTDNPSSPPTELPSPAPSRKPSAAPTALTFPIYFPPGTTYSKNGPGNTGCLTNTGACYSDGCAGQDTTGWASYAYYTETVVSPAEGFNWDTYPVWNLALVIGGWDCAANYCAGPNDCCFDDPLMGGTQLDLSNTDFVFHEDTMFESAGWATKTRVSIDGQPVRYYYDGGNRFLGVTGGRVMTVNSGGYCGYTNVHYKVTLRQ